MVPDNQSINKLATFSLALRKIFIRLHENICGDCSRRQTLSKWGRGEHGHHNRQTVQVLQTETRCGFYK